MDLLIFLQAANLNNYDSLVALLPLILGLILFFFVLMLIVYIYSSLAFMAISRKTGVGPAGIAWIPFVGKPLLSAKIAKMHWWPLLLLLVYILNPIAGLADSTVVAISAMIIVWTGTIIFMIYWIIWGWKVFEAVGRPGWWMILSIIPLLGFVLYLILLGVAAWGKPMNGRKGNF